MAVTVYVRRRRLNLMLGLRRVEQGLSIATSGPLLSFAFIDFPEGAADGVNHERMPVLLSEEADFETWLSGSPAEAFALARSCDPGAMRIVQSGFEKKDLLAA